MRHLTVSLGGPVPALSTAGPAVPTMPAHCYKCKWRFEIPRTARNAVERCPRCQSTQVIPHNTEPAQAAPFMLDDVWLDGFISMQLPGQRRGARA